MLDTRLGDLPSKALGDFSDLGDAAPLRDQTRNVGARGQKTAVGQLLNAESGRGFVHGLSTRASCNGSSRTRDVQRTTLILPMTFLRSRPRSGATANAEPCLTPA